MRRRCRNKKRRSIAWGKKTMVAIHTFDELHGSSPTLQNWDRESTVRKIAGNNK
jgi:hypothetical protein